MRWKEDYHYFLRKNKGYDEKRILGSYLMKRGSCTCPLSKMSCGPMDPYEYTVHCRKCQNEVSASETPRIGPVATSQEAAEARSDDKFQQAA